MTDDETDDFYEIVGSENYENSRDEFLAGIKKCSDNVFSYDEETKTIVFEKACGELVVHYPELYTEIFCKKCQICVEINKPITSVGSEFTEEPEDELDEFMAIAGTEYFKNDDDVSEYDNDLKDEAPSAYPSAPTGGQPYPSIEDESDY